jgi:hypothetical protein
MTTDHWAVVMFLGAFIAGTWSTWDLWAIHRAELPPRNRITRAFVVVAILITAAAGFYGFLAARRILGFETIPGISVVSLLLASAVLLVPVFLRMTVRQIRDGR